MFNRNEKYAYERGYRVTFDGEMVNPEGKKVGYYSSTGYLMHKIRFGTSKEGKYKRFLVSRWQAFQKYGEAIYCPGIVVRHLNWVKTDNSYDNIRIGNNRDNLLDIPKEDRVKNAIKASRKIAKYNVDEVRKYHNKVQSYKQTMEKFNIPSTGSLRDVLNRHNINKIDKGEDWFSRGGGVVVRR